MEATASSRSRFPELAKYDVVEEIGHGGMATVYLARDRRLGRDVAVKVIHPHLRDSREVVSRFHAEAKAVAKLRHPNIVEVFDVSDEGEREQYLVVELLRGTTLRKLLQKHGAIPPEIAAAFALELLAAVGHANSSGVVHRDIKPENVLIELKPAVRKDGETPAPASGNASSDRLLVKLTDFGIAKLLDAQGVTSTGQVLGSPAHMAPEQIEGGDVDGRADVFGMGVLFYECMVGHLPFEGTNPAQVLRRVLDGIYPEAQAERPVVGATWSAILDRALARAPADRFADAGAMRDAILAELGRLGIDRPRREIEAWLDDPEARAVQHDKRMIDKLCTLGAEERRRGDAIAAAADYNRALAHAPHDPQLLRIVAGMNRTEARTRLLRRAGVALSLMVGLGGAAFAIGHVVKGHSGQTTPSASAVVITEPPGPSAPPSASTAPSASAHATVVIPMRPVPVAPPKVIERTITLDLTPSMGVTVSIDDGPSRRVATGATLPFDGKAHTLLFGCPVCTTVSRDLAAGDKDEPLTVRLPILPASLNIQGDGNKTYQIVQYPDISVHVGGPNRVPLHSEYEQVTVLQIESGASVSVRLHAGTSVDAPLPL